MIRVLSVHLCTALDLLGNENSSQCGWHSEIKILSRTSASQTGVGAGGLGLSSYLEKGGPPRVSLGTTA